MGGSYGGFDGGSSGFDGGFDGFDDGFDGSMVAPMASMASMVAPVAPVVASMAPLASMVEALDWSKRMTAESRSGGERADGWTHKIREGRVEGLTTRIVRERADGLTHKIREELTAGWTLLVGVVQFVTWARTKRATSLVDSMALMVRIASTLALMVASMVATMVASMASSRSKVETTAKGDRADLKDKCQNGRRCHGSTVALMVASMVASVASMASMASMVASRASVVAVVASMASMIVPLEWLNLLVAEPKRGDERAGGLTLKYEGALTVALEMASVVTAWMAPMTPLMASMAPIASLASMVASMALLVVLLASMASMVASLDRLRLMIEPKICEERVERLTHKICEERADELTLKIDGERVQRLTHNISEERADGLTYRKVVTQMLVDGDGSESGGFRWTKTRATSCHRRTQKKFESSSTLGCVRCEKNWLRMAQVTPSTEFYECALRKWEELLTWVATVVDGDGVDGVDGGLGWRRVVVASMASMASNGGFDGVDGGLVASMASNGGVELGSSTQRALTWKSLCVPSGEDDTHSGSLFFV